MHNPYGLDFYALHAATAEPKPPSDPHAQRARHNTLNQLITLGVSRNVLAQTCQVEPSTIGRWLHNGVVTRSALPRRALDRLGPILMHMREDLALDDATIRDFMQNQTKRPSGYKPQLDERWTPSIQEGHSYPLVAWVGHYSPERPKLTEEHESRHDGLFMIKGRLRSLYAPRYQDLPQRPPQRASL